MNAVEQLMTVVLQHPTYLASGAGALAVLIVLVLVMRRKGSATAAQAKPAGTGKSTNLASRDETPRGGPAAARSAAKPAGGRSSSQTLDTQLGGSPAAGKEKDPFKDEPDPRLVTQYQEGTGEGIEEIEARLGEDPNNEDLLDWLAFMYYSNGKLEKAIDTYQRAINLNYENEHQHYYLGNAYYKLGKFDRAVEEWEVVVQLKPDSKLAQNAQERIRKVKAQGK